MAVINGVMMQYFHRHLKATDNLWQQVAQEAQPLAAVGFTALWLPPAFKGATGIEDDGYGVYDLYDLGEFEQKGSIRTKYGNRQDYLNAIDRLHHYQLQVYADAPLHQRLGGDHPERVPVIPYQPSDLTNPSGEQRDFKNPTHFAFPGRQGKYSDFEWHWWHFSAFTDNDRDSDYQWVYRFEDKVFDDDIAQQSPNVPRPLGYEVDFQNLDVQREIEHWGNWFLETTQVDGFRLAATKKSSTGYFPRWIDALEKHSGKQLFVVGSYWQENVSALHWYLDTVGGQISLFDVPLHNNFHQASRARGNYDMRRILNGTLMQQRPWNAVTFVDTHDAQPGQAFESPVESWFKPLAHTLILLRQEGYPCVYYPDYYGIDYVDIDAEGRSYSRHSPGHRRLLDKLLQVRRNYLYGPQYSYFDHWNCVGWTCLGNAEHPKAMAVILSDGPAGWKWMEVSKPHAQFTDITGHIPEPVFANEYGWAEFRCQGGSVSVWVQT